MTYKHRSGCSQLSLFFFVVSWLSKENGRGQCLFESSFRLESRQTVAGSKLSTQKMKSWKMFFHGISNQTGIQKNFTCDDVRFLSFVPHVVLSIVI